MLWVTPLSCWNTGQCWSKSSSNRALGYLSSGYLNRKAFSLVYKGREVQIMPNLGMSCRGGDQAGWSRLVWGFVSLHGSQQASLRWLQQGLEWAPSGQVFIFSKNHVKTCSDWQSDSVGREWPKPELPAALPVHFFKLDQSENTLPCKTCYCSAFFIQIWIKK